DAQNFYGPPVASGTYSGSPVSIPMAGLSKAVPSGFVTPAHTAPLFGTFVVMSSNGIASPPVTPPTPTVTVSVSPSGASLQGGAQQQLTAIVNGSPNQSVTWSLAGPGTLTNGLYTAPSVVSSQQNITVTATSVFDPSKSAQATITLN